MKPHCPICKKEIEWEGNRYRPFCSERCKLVDLGRWASGAYRVPTGPEAEEEEAAPERPDGPEESSDDRAADGDPPGNRA